MSPCLLAPAHVRDRVYAYVLHSYVRACPTEKCTLESIRSFNAPCVLPCARGLMPMEVIQLSLVFSFVNISNAASIIIFFAFANIAKGAFMPRNRNFTGLSKYGDAT